MYESDIVEQLVAVLGARVLRSRAQLATFSCDALTAFQRHPLAVVLVESADEVVAVVRLCHATGTPFVARGSGTSLSGGSLPVEGGIVIALNRLDQILEIDPETRTAVVEPGAINLAVSTAAAPHGLAYAPDPSSQSVCTIGGNLAFNAGGAHCLKWGMTSNHVLGMKVVLPDGEVVELGDASTETVGPDWTGMFVGSEGLFGIAIEVTLRLVPVAEATRTSLAVYDSLEAAGDAVARILGAGLLPVAMEIMDGLAMELAASATGADFPPGAAALLVVELQGERELVAADGERLDAVLAASAAVTARATEDPDERARIWKVRKAAFTVAGLLAADYIVQDGVVPRTRLAATLAEIARMSAEAGIRVANVFHAGDGNLHPFILFDGREEGMWERAEALAFAIVALCVEQGGSITGEHGVGVEKREFLSLMFGPDDLELMHRLRRGVDPAGLANRGKMLAPEAVTA
jgi:glycolate oxidase